jgi:nonsense-mediated mRNA decay protein 3
MGSQELEEDPEMRTKVALFRDPAYDPAAAADARESDMTDDSDGEVPEVCVGRANVGVVAGELLG